MKKIIYVDMDGVISNFEKGTENLNPKEKKRPDLHVNYRNLEIIPGAKLALNTSSLYTLTKNLPSNFAEFSKV